MKKNIILDVSEEDICDGVTVEGLGLDPGFGENLKIEENIDSP